MPYIARERRVALDAWVDGLMDSLDLPILPGELNYLITKLLLETKPNTYRDFNTLVGVLECAKLEFYRRVVEPYETRKRNEHGEVYH